MFSLQMFKAAAAAESSSWWVSKAYGRLKKDYVAYEAISSSTHSS
jgi:hypothetical protein